jgi:branched-chain amino acid transport system substrate-binding protein
MDAQMISGDALQTEEFWSITGPAGEGMLFTFGPDPRKKPSAAAVVKKFKDKGIDPEGYTLYTYAAIQEWAEAAKKAGTTDPKKVASTLKSGTWDTVLGNLSYTPKGDITKVDYVMYRWNKDGTYAELPGQS